MCMPFGESAGTWLQQHIGPGRARCDNSLGVRRASSAVKVPLQALYMCDTHTHTKVGYDPSLGDTLHTHNHRKRTVSRMSSSMASSLTWLVPNMPAALPVLMAAAVDLPAVARVWACVSPMLTGLWAACLHLTCTSRSCQFQHASCQLPHSLQCLLLGEARCEPASS